MADYITALNPSTIDKFSWRRVWMLFQLYYPGLKKQIIAMPIVTFVATIIGGIYCRLGYEISTSLIIPLFTTGVFLYFTPIGLAHKNYQDLSVILPVKTSEKFAFLVLYFFVFLNIENNLSFFLSLLIVYSNISGGIPAFFDLAKMAFQQFGLSLFICSVPVYITLIAIMLLTIISSRRNRIIKTIVAMLISFITLIMSSGILGLIIGVCVGLGILSQTYLEDVTSLQRLIFLIFGFISIIPAALSLSLLYRKLKTSGI